jgi:hypothetical protein
MPAAGSGRATPGSGLAPPGPLIAEIVQAGAVGHRGAPGLGGDAYHLGDELALAEVAAFARTAGERRVVELVRLDDHMSQAEPCGEVAGGLQFLRRVRRGDGREGDHPRRSQSARGRGRNETRIDAAREGHTGRAQLRRLGLEPLQGSARLLAGLSVRCTFGAPLVDPTTSVNHRSRPDP